MPLVTGDIPSLHNGVSQQSAMVRSSEQAEEQVNGWSSLALGLSKRAPTQHVARIMSEWPESVFVHTINRDEVEQYVVVALDGAIRVFDLLTGIEQPVAAPGGWDYLAGVSDYATDVAFYTVADYTFVVNKRKVVELASAGVDSAPQSNGLIWINRGIGEDADGLLYAPGDLYQYAPNPTTSALQGVVASMDKLPEAPAQGALYQVSGTSTTGFASYYVVRNGGVWDEAVAPGLRNAILPQTMPHALVRRGDGSFHFAPFSWAPRRVGDLDSNPPPGFVGRTIRSLLFYQNRLGLLYGENITLSATGDFGNFFRNTVLDYIDSDVMDVAATNTSSPSGGVTTLEHAVGFDDGIMLFSAQTQFSLSNGEAGISASSTAIKPVTNYEVALAAAPVPMGSEAYFGSEKNGWAAIYEYTRGSDSDATSASCVTAHVPAYIPAGLHKLIPAQDLNALFVLTTGAANRVYVYQLYWQDAQSKVQSAWHFWEFPEDVVIYSGAYTKGNLTLVMARPDGLCLERIDLSAEARPPQADAEIYLDRRCAVTGVYNPGTLRTRFQLPYAVGRTADYQLVRGSAHTARPLSLVDTTGYTWLGPSLVEVPGNETAGPLLGGERFTFRYTFSPQFLRRQNGAAISTGRLQLRTFTVSYRETGYFQTLVYPYGDAAPASVEEVLPGKLAAFTGKVVGAADLKLNRPVFHEGVYSFSVGGEARTARVSLVNDTHVSSTFVGAEWEALYWNRASA